MIMPPHQLPRAPGSNASGKNIPEGSGRQESSAAARQSDSSDLHKQSGRDSLRPGHNNGERALDVVPTKGYPSDSITSARSGEREGRHRVESDEGSLRLDVEPKGFSTDPGSFPTPGGRSICNQIDIPTAPVLQLEARPSGGGDRCLSPRLEAGERIRKPSMEPCGESVIEGGSSGGGTNTNSPSLALTTMVSQATELAGGTTIEDRPVMVEEDLPDLIPPLAVWPISGNTTQVKNFQRRLQTSSYHHGDQRHTSLTIHSVRSGLAGVLNGIMIRFQDL